MKVKVFLERENKAIEVFLEEGSVKELIKKLGLQKNRFVLVKGDEVLLEEDELNEGDFIRVIDVVSGG